MKYIPSILSFILLNGCAPLSAPIVLPSPLAPTATPTVSATPPSIPTATPSPSPSSDLPSRDCLPESAEVHFRLYANPRNLASYYSESNLDFSTPVKPLRVIADGQTFTFQENTFRLPRSVLQTSLEIQAEGYASLKRPLSRPYAPLCANMYGALSPLSQEEQTGTEIPLESLDLYAVQALPPFLKNDSSSDFSYALIRETTELTPLLNWLNERKPEELSTPKLQEQLSKALNEGQMIVLFSNNSSQMGDTYGVLDTARETPNRIVLASHKATLIQYPLPPLPVGDIFFKRLEIKLLQKTNKPLIVDALRAGVGSPKVRLELK